MTLCKGHIVTFSNSFHPDSHSPHLLETSFNLERVVLGNLNIPSRRVREFEQVLRSLHIAIVPSCLTTDPSIAVPWYRKH